MPITHDWRPEPFKSGKAKAIIDGWSPEEFENHLEHFIAYHGSRANVLVWQDAWRTWVLNSLNFGAKRNGSGRTDQQHDRTLAAAEAAFGPASEWTDDKPF